MLEWTAATVCYIYAWEKREISGVKRGIIDNMSFLERIVRDESL